MSDRGVGEARVGPGRARPPRLVTRLAAWLMVLGLAASFALPVRGLGPSVCAVKSLTGLDCPGCGLTRSVTAISHLQLARAWHFNPFGPVFYGLMWIGAATVLLPRGMVERCGRRLEPHRKRLDAALWLLALAMLVFGVIRAVLQAAASSVL